jgi:6-phosphogluconate dehydrogenase
MQLIAEAYDILKRGLGLNESEIADIFLTWNKGVLDSFLIQITAEILKFNDDDGEPVLTKILDKAQQKGTGKWTAIAALDAGMPGEHCLPIIFVTMQTNLSFSHPHRRGRICPLPVCHQGGAYPCEQSHCRPSERDFPWRQEAVH